MSRRVRDLRGSQDRTPAPLQAFTEKFDRVRRLACSIYADGICNMAYLGHNQGVTGTGSLWAVPICYGSIPHISIASLRKELAT